jgi:hypothetical protein
MMMMMVMGDGQEDRSGGRMSETQRLDYISPTPRKLEHAQQIRNSAQSLVDHQTHEFGIKLFMNAFLSWWVNHLEGYIDMCINHSERKIWDGTGFCRGEGHWSATPSNTLFLNPSLSFRLELAKQVMMRVSELTL